jgi:hypothetical protein
MPAAIVVVVVAVIVVVVVIFAIVVIGVAIQASGKRASRALKWRAQLGGRGVWEGRA